MDTKLSKVGAESGFKVGTKPVLGGIKCLLEMLLNVNNAVDGWRVMKFALVRIGKMVKRSSLFLLIQARKTSPKKLKRPWDLRFFPRLTEQRALFAGRRIWTRSKMEHLCQKIQNTTETGSVQNACANALTM